MSALQIRAAGLTDVGLARQHNEDCFEIDDEHQLFVVADGMGGHTHGEVASRIAVDSIRAFVGGDEDDYVLRFPAEPELAQHSSQLKNAVRTAHYQVLRAIQEDGGLEGMGTTVVGVLVHDDVAALAHVGDSRVYRCRAGEFERLTEDHTWVNEQVLAGCLSEEQARVHPLKNVVTRALGSEKEVLVDLQEIELQPHDRLLICSDGLTAMLVDNDIAEHVSREASLEEIAQGLVNEANRRGGLDNITVVVLDVVEQDAAS